MADVNSSVDVLDFDEDWYLPHTRFVFFKLGKRMEVGKYDSALGIYFIERVPSQHFLRKLRSYGVSLQILKILRFNGCRAIHLTELGATGRKEWGAALELFFNTGHKWKNNIWPNDDQLQLELQFWTELTGRYTPEDFVRKTPEGQQVLHIYPGST